MLLAISVGALLGLISLFFIYMQSRRAENLAERIDRTRFPRTGVHPVDGLQGIAVIVEATGNHEVVLTVFRQSGNIERVEVYANVIYAIEAAATVFRRMREHEVRVWENNSDLLDIRRPHYNAKGSSEGKKIWGIRIEPARNAS